MSFSSDVPLTSNQQSVSLEIPNYDNPYFLEILSLYLKRIADSLNTKEGALHSLQEVASFQQYFNYVPVPPAPAAFTPDPFFFRPGYRRTYDLVALNAGVAIPVGVTVFALAGDDLINGIAVPVNGYTAATNPGPIYRFNGALLDVSFNNTVPAAQTIIVTNNTGAVLNQCYFNIEYLKIA